MPLSESIFFFFGTRGDLLFAKEVKITKLPKHLKKRTGFFATQMHLMNK